MVVLSVYLIFLYLIFVTVFEYSGCKKFEFPVNSRWWTVWHEVLLIVSGDVWMFCLLAFTDFGGYLVCLSQCWYENAALSVLFSMLKSVVDKVHRSSTWVKVQIRIIKYYSSKSTAFSILLEWKYKSTQFFMYLSKKVLIDRFILQFYIDYFI